MDEWKWAHSPLTGNCPTCGALVYDVEIKKEHYAQYTCLCFLSRKTDVGLAVCPQCKITLKLTGPNELSQYEADCPVCKKSRVL
jgi:ssDNA-binding Zn-finger/Zn-ribbon topoisomerase 1